MKDREGGREGDFAISSCPPFSSNHFRVHGRGRDFSLGPLLLQPLISDEGFSSVEYRPIYTLGRHDNS